MVNKREVILVGAGSCDDLKYRLIKKQLESMDFVIVSLEDATDETTRIDLDEVMILHSDPPIPDLDAMKYPYCDMPKKKFKERKPKMSKKERRLHR